MLLRRTGPVVADAGRRGGRGLPAEGRRRRAGFSKSRVQKVRAPTTFPPRDGELIYHPACLAPIWKNTDMEMTADTIGFMAVGLAILALLWNLHRDIGVLNKDMGALRQEMHRDIGALRQDMSDLRGRVSRVEGMLAGAGLKVAPDSASG